MDNAIFGTLAFLARVLLLPALLVGTSILFYRARTQNTLWLFVSTAVVCLGRLVQIFAPFDRDSGSFPPMWLAGEIMVSLGSVGLAVFFVLFSLSYSGYKANGKQ